MSQAANLINKNLYLRTKKLFFPFVRGQKLFFRMYAPIGRNPKQNSFPAENENSAPQHPSCQNAGKSYLVF